MNHQAEASRRVIWHGYRWRGPEKLLRSRSDFPPPVAREWRYYPDLCIGGWSEVGHALAWLWDGMNQIYRGLVTRYPARAIALNDEYRDAEHRLLHHPECACQWDIRLPNEHRLCMAIIAVYSPNKLPSTNDNPMGNSYR